MTKKQYNNSAPDLWLESQKEAIRALKPDHKVDVTDAVMKQIASMPVPKPMPEIGRGRRVVLWVAAACVAGIVASAAIFINHNASPVSTSNDFSARLLDIYEYCNDYTDGDSEMDYEYEDEAAYNDNPVAYFL